MAGTFDPDPEKDLLFMIFLAAQSYLINGSTRARQRLYAYVLEYRWRYLVMGDTDETEVRHG